MCLCCFIHQLLSVHSQSKNTYAKLNWFCKLMSGMNQTTASMKRDVTWCAESEDYRSRLVLLTVAIYYYKGLNSGM
jgi:hypothetical protein